jgi:hypothetical protein
MELTCSRCHQTVQPGDCYCPVCGLPQLVYTADGSAGSGQPDRWSDAVRDAGAVDWKPAIRSALALAVPAGILCAGLTRIGPIGALLIPVAAAWVVARYMRNQRPPWITIGAGARIGLMTGILGGWAAALTTGVTLYAQRFWFHQGKTFDDLWQNQVIEVSQQLSSMGFDAQAIAANKVLMLSPEGRAGSMLFNTGLLAMIILAFAVGGGALSARLLGRPRRTEN